MSAVRTHDVTLNQGSNKVTAALRDVLLNPVDPFTSVSESTSMPLIAAGAGSAANVWQRAEPLGPSGPEFFKMRCEEEASVAFPQSGINKVRGAAWSSDGTSFAVSSYQGLICLWEREISQGIRDPWAVAAVLALPGSEEDKVPCRTLAWSPAGDQLAGGTDGMGVHWFSRSEASGTWALAGSYYHAGDVKQVAWSPDGKYIAMASRDGVLGVINTRDVSPELTTLTGHVGDVKSGKDDPPPPPSDP